MKIRNPFSCSFYLLRHWGMIHILPALEVTITYNKPSFTFCWWILRFDLNIHYHLPNWFMKYIWGFLHLDFIDWFKKDKGEE